MRTQDEPSKADQFFRSGAAHIAKAKQMTGRCPAMAIRPEDPEWAAWERYFLGHLRWRPAVMKMVLAGLINSMTVPCQWPEYLDDSYRSEAA